MRKLLNKIKDALFHPSSSFPVLTYEGVAIKFIKTVGIEDELNLQTPIKFPNDCWIWKVALSPTGIFWLMDASEDWFMLEMTDKEVPLVLQQLYPILMDIQLQQYKTA